MILKERQDGVLVLTLNRPEKLNATDGPLHFGLSRVWDDVHDDPETRVVVVTGAGDGIGRSAFNAIRSWF